MLEIDRDVPIPPQGNKKYPWAELKVGDSFFVPYSDKENLHRGKRLQSAISNLAAAYARSYPGKKFLTRAIVEDSVRGVRVWRKS